jgi:hypothetical protein
MLIGNFLHSIGFEKSANIKPSQPYPLNISLYPITTEEYLKTPLNTIYRMVLNENYYWFKYIKIDSIPTHDVNKDRTKSLLIAKMAQIIYQAHRFCYKILEIHQIQRIPYSVKNEYTFTIRIRSSYPLHKITLDRIRLLERIINNTVYDTVPENFIKNTLTTYALESYLFLKPNEDPAYLNAIETLKSHGVYKLTDGNDQNKLSESTLKSNCFYEGVSIRNYKNYINNMSYQDLFYDIHIYNNKKLLVNVDFITNLFFKVEGALENYINNAIDNNDRAVFWRIEQYMLPFITPQLNSRMKPLIKYLDTIRYQIDPFIENFPSYENIPSRGLNFDINNTFRLLTTMMNILHTNTIKRLLNINIELSNFDINTVNSYEPPYKRALFHYTYNLVHKNKLNIDENYKIPHMAGGSVMINIVNINFLELLTKFININLFRRK